VHHAPHPQTHTPFGPTASPHPLTPTPTWGVHTPTHTPDPHPLVVDALQGVVRVAVVRLLPGGRQRGYIGVQEVDVGLGGGEWGNVCVCVWGGGRVGG
jgi:hypothetical protein